MKMEARGDRFGLYLLPQALPAYAGTRPAGCVVYNGSKVGIPPEAVDAKFIAKGTERRTEIGPDTKLGPG